MLKLKLQYFGLLMRRSDSFEKTLMLGKIEGGRRRGWQRMRQLDGITTQWTWVWVNSGSWWWTGRPGVPQSVGLQRVRHDWATDLNWLLVPLCIAFLLRSNCIEWDDSWGWNPEIHKWSRWSLGRGMVGQRRSQVSIGSLKPRDGLVRWSGRRVMLQRVAQ